MKTLLRDSQFCRLCCEESPNGVKLFDDKTKICDLVNKYLPVSIVDDGSLPTTICQGCHIHVRDIASFHSLIDEGQKKIKSLHEKEMEYLNSIKELPVKIEDGFILIKEEGSVNRQQANISSGIDVMEMQHNNESSIGESSIQVKETEPAAKRKRGRPKKVDSPVPVTPFLERSVRIRKQPSRFSEMFQGKELENVLIKENITHETEVVDDGLYENEVEDEQATDQSQPVIGVIGWMQTKCGKTLGNVICKKRGGVLKGTSGITRLQCTVCKKEYFQKGVLLRHLLKDDCGPPGITFDDIICPTFNITTTVQEMHLLNADVEVNDLEDLSVGGKSRKKYVCLLCHKSFPKKCSLVYHEEKEHTHHIFTCSTCDKHFKHRLLLLRHQKCHEESRPYVCDVCSLSFKYPSNLALHKLSHSSSGRFTCSFCSALFNTKTSLELHIRVHLGYKPFQCSVCHKGFSQKNNLQEHFRIHSGEKPFKCSCCFKEFKTSSQLRTHMLTHNEMKPYNCGECPKSFRHKDAYAAHIKRHTGEKRFPCIHCGKLEGASVKKHERLHVGEKRLACKHCDKPFTDSSNLAKHKKKAHGGGLDNLARVIYLNLDLPDQDLNHLDIGNINEESNTNNLSVLNLALGHCETELEDSSLQSKNLPLVFKTLDQQNIKDKDLNIALSDIQSQLGDNSQLSVPIVLKSLGSNVEGKHNNQLPIFSAENMPLVLKSLEESTCRGKDMPLVLDSVVDSENSSNQSLSLSHNQDRISLALSSHQSQIQDLKDLSGLVESSRQIVTDSQGIPIKITLSDGTQLQVTTTDGESLEVITNDGVPIPVRLSGHSEYLMSQSLPNIDSLTMEGALNDLSHLSQDYEVQFVEGHSIKLLSSSSEQMKLLSSASDGEQDDQSIKLLTTAQEHGIHLLEEHQALKLLPSSSEEISSSSHNDPDMTLLSSGSSSSFKLSSRSTSRTNTSLFMTDCHTSNILYNPDHE